MNRIGKPVSIYEKAFILIVATFTILVLVFGVAAIFVPEFRLQGSTIVGVILAAITTMASTLGSAYLAKSVRNRKDGGDDD